MSDKGKTQAAVAVYKNNMNATPAELKKLGFEGEPSKEYIKEEVLSILAEAYVNLVDAANGYVEAKLNESKS